MMVVIGRNASKTGSEAMTTALHEGVLRTLRAEFGRLRSAGDRALAQVTSDEAFHARIDDAESNSLAIIVRHVAGNLRSRWTGFLTADGEKGWRDRDAEFDLDRRDTRAELMAAWSSAWDLAERGLAALAPADLERTVLIRNESFTVHEALMRQLTHYAEHTGQIVLLAKHVAGSGWKTLTIPRGRSAKSPKTA
jgi:hypothetical protein